MSLKIKEVQIREWYTGAKHDGFGNHLKTLKIVGRVTGYEDEPKNCFVINFEWEPHRKGQNLSFGGNLQGSLKRKKTQQEFTDFCKQVKQLTWYKVISQFKEEQRFFLDRFKPYKNFSDESVQETFSFSTTLNLLKQGECLTRLAWREHYQDGRYLKLKDGIFTMYECTDGMNGSFTCYTEDVMAEDWIIVEAVDTEIKKIRDFFTLVTDDDSLIQKGLDYNVWYTYLTKDFVLNLRDLFKIEHSFNFVGEQEGYFHLGFFQPDYPEQWNPYLGVTEAEFKQLDEMTHTILIYHDLKNDKECGAGKIRIVGTKKDLLRSLILELESMRYKGQIESFKEV